MSPSRCSLREKQRVYVRVFSGCMWEERLGAHGHVTVQGMCMCMCMEGDMCGVGAGM